MIYAFKGTIIHARAHTKKKPSIVRRASVVFRKLSAGLRA